MPRYLRAYFEPRIGADLGDVRIHDDPGAATSARELGAAAYTVGSDIVFARGAFAPATSSGLGLLAHELTHVVQQRRGTGGGAVAPVQRQEADEGLTLGELLAEAVMRSPRLMRERAIELTDEIGPILSDMDRYDPLFERTYDTYWGLARLAFQLRDVPSDQETTPAQRQRAEELGREWVEIEEALESRRRSEARDRLQQARAGAEALRLQILYAYRDIYMAGEDPEDVDVGAVTMRTLADRTKDLLSAINAADASITGRSITPLIPVLDKALSLTDLILNWQVTSGLAAESQHHIDALRNAWNASSTAVGLAGFGGFLPFFAHIGPALDQIAAGWARVVGELQEENRRWWQARDVMGEELPHPSAMPGGGTVFRYMRDVFEATEPPPGEAPEEVLEFFEDNREMFSRVATEVMGRSWSEVPTRRSWIFWREVDPEELNSWVFYNREMVWRLIYGSGMEPPS